MSIIIIQPDAAAGKDSCTDKGAPNTNYGTQIWCKLYQTAVEMQRESYFQFDLSSIPAGSIINSAILGLYLFYNGLGVGVNAEAQFPAIAWDEATLTWNNKPANLGFLIWSGSISSALEWKYLDLLNAVRDWFSGAAPNNGLKLYPVGLTAYDGAFYSSDEVGNPTLRPKLTINYTPPGARPGSLSMMGIGV